MKITEFPLIRSKDNPRIKNARAVREGRTDTMIFVEGFRLVSEILLSSVRPETVFISEPQLGKNRELVELLIDRYEVEVQLVQEHVFNTLADTGNSQGIVVLAHRPEVLMLEHLNLANKLIVYLQEVNNPSNLGAAARTAEAAGVEVLVTSPRSADLFSPKSVRSSMGSAFRLKIGQNIPWSEMVDLARRNGLAVYAADGHADRSYLDVDWRTGALIVFGSEAHGLSKAQIEAADDLFCIPLENGVESLNLAVAAGVTLFEAKRQRSMG